MTEEVKELVENRVREVKRYVVTRFEQSGREGSSSVHGEFDNFDVAYQVGYALCKAEHDRLGYPPCDERIQYPLSTPPGTTMTLDPSFHSAEECAEIGTCVVNAEGEIEAVE